MTGTSSGVIYLDLDRQWTGEAGNWQYADDLKRIMAPYDKNGQLGNTIGDIGAGESPISFSLTSPQRLVLFDVSGVILPLDKQGKEVIKIHANIEDMISAGNLGSAQQYAPFDTFVDSNIFSYLDNWRGLLSLQAANHRNGGYLFTATLLNQGDLVQLLSQDCPKLHREILDAIVARGYEIEKHSEDGELSVIVARRI